MIFSFEPYLASAASAIPDRAAGGQGGAATAAAVAAGPSNKEITNAAQTAYKQYQAAVDSMTLALLNMLNDSALADTIVKLDGTNWSSPGISGGLANPIFDSVDYQTFAGVARSTSQNLLSAGVGVFAKNLSMASNSPGMIGYARDLAGSKGSGVILSLDILNSLVSVSSTSNLQLSVWLPACDQLHDSVTGLYMSATVRGVSIILKILLTKTLAPYGFAVSSGTQLNLPLSSGIFAGSTQQWQPAS